MITHPRSEDTGEAQARTEVVTLTMPIPPSLNTMMSGRLSDRIKRKSDLGWQAVAAWHESMKPRFSGPVMIDARFYFPDRRRRDRENYGAGGLKSIIDTLVTLEVIERDDHEWLDMTVYMLHDADNPRLELWIREAGHTP